ASSTPVTVPPLATVPPTTPSTTQPTSPSTSPSMSPSMSSPTSAEPSPTTAPLSPLAAMLGERASAIPPVVERRLRPVGLRIGEIFVDDRVVEVGLEDDGELEVPGAEEIGWY